MFKRREFITLLGGMAVAWPLMAPAQQPVKRHRLGVLLYSTPQADPQMKPLTRGLRELGYIDGQNLAIEYRYADGRSERLPDLAAELVGLKPDALVSMGGDVTVAAVKATQKIPIIFTSSADPVQLGFVASLARPGGNATGITLLMDDLAAKRLELLKEVAPRVSRVAFLWHPDHIDNELREAARSAPALGVHLERLPIYAAGDLDGAFRAVIKTKAEAMYVVSSRLTLRNLRRLVDFAIDSRLPLIGGFGAWAQAGGLMSYGPNVDDMVHRAATYVDKILKGASPADLPVQQPTRFELVINLKAAKALGLTIAESYLTRADEVIE